MSPNHAIRSQARTPVIPVPLRSKTLRMDAPGMFQCIILRAFELRPEYRDVFLLKEIPGYTLTEIADILGISIDTVQARWKSARREIGHLGDSDAMEHTK